MKANIACVHGIKINKGRDVLRNISDVPSFTFIRTNIPFDLACEGEVPDLIKDGHFLVTNYDWVIFSSRSGCVVDLLKDKKWWRNVEFCESVEITPNIISTNSYEHEPFYGVIDLEMPAFDELTHFMINSASIEKPSFGKRILIVAYNIDFEDRAINKVRANIKRNIKNNKTVWNARYFDGIAFTDNRHGESLAVDLHDYLNVDEVEEYLLIEPIRVILPDVSGLSPLDNWVKSIGAGR